MANLETEYFQHRENANSGGWGAMIFFFMMRFVRLAKHVQHMSLHLI